MSLSGAVLDTSGVAVAGAPDYEQDADRALHDRAAHDRAGLQRLKMAAEQAKCAVSTVDQKHLSLTLLPDSKGESYRLSAKLTRAFLEELVEPLVKRCLDIVDPRYVRGKEPRWRLGESRTEAGASRRPCVALRLPWRYPPQLWNLRES
ncbi:MAG: Hsp70 family protein [Deltaproteobacteria bacterium]|nr:Hsp70 family protein [Deltaproteobacteria bacterium]